MGLLLDLCCIQGPGSKVDPDLAQEAKQRVMSAIADEGT